MRKKDIYNIIYIINLLQTLFMIHQIVTYEYYIKNSIDYHKLFLLKSV